MDIEREKLILKVIAGQATSEELQEMTAWLDANPDQKEVFEAMKMMMSRQTSPGDSEPDPATMAFAKLEATRKRRIRLITLRNQAGIFLLVLSAMTALLSFFHYYTQAPKTTGEYVFTNASFAEIKEVIEERMNIEVEAETPAILGCRFTGTFPASATADDVLEGITYRTGVSVHKVDRRYVLRGSGCDITR